ncbi:hypothetical protein VC83_00714 [Pseudogymnoascus destructans]|uniref:SET domain-containing protein n=2 Tax=Pseudogymnoascus destructans TaxID=655981 RepID=L8GBC5_PSED2|nr:uncharacterized protein VC83_00714 [Pseudogymnoascus destructans]ELR10159.1 hypothetical protein GMDG_04553 [Pseudogymnoascus destructans 20631-21]OAF62393.1 hypothetical protein VC83_00714 [Pseudogymnoascus destructans]
MDAHDVTTQYMEPLRKFKKMLEEAKKRQGERPNDRKPPEYACMRFMMAFGTLGQNKPGHSIHTSFVAPAYSPCIIPVADLKHVTIDELLLETHHRGTCILLRCITPPNRMTAIMVLAEDKNNDVVCLQMYQQENEETRPATDIANPGVVLLVKEPYYKIMSDGEYGLRVDHLSDIVHLKSDDVRIPSDWQPRVIEVEQSAEALKLKGNSAMKKGKFWDSIAIYSDALVQPTSVDEAEIIKRNRSLAFLRTKQFDAALSDTGFPNFGENASEKAMFRAGEALYYLGRFDECRNVLAMLCRLYPLNALARASSDRAESRLREQKTGEFNFKLLQAEAKKLRPPHLDHATYIGPVEVRQTASNGRGLFVTKAVKAGDSLLCEKAFAHCYAPEKSDAEKAGESIISILMNPETNTAFMGTQADLLMSVVQKMYHNPSVSSAFTALYHGGYKGVDATAVDQTPIVDTFQVERTISFNSFGCPLSSVNSQAKVRDHKDEPHTAFHSTGIWIQASYINHSCTSNARRAFIGDMMIVRATCDLKKDTELSFWYRCPIKHNAADAQSKFENWGFECACSICSDNKSTAPPVLRKREKLRTSIEKAFKVASLGSGLLQKIERLIDELNQTYSQPADKVPRLLVWDPQLALAQAYASLNQTRKCIVAVGKILTSLGFLISGTDSPQTPFSIDRWGMLQDYLVEAFVLLRNMFLVTKAVENSKKAGEYARTVYRMVVGEDATFERVWGAEGL